MELSVLESQVDHLACQGTVLSLYEVTGLQVGLSQLQANLHLNKVFFWGKIIGIVKDYYVATAFVDRGSVFPQKLFFYSLDKFQFAELPDVPQGLRDIIDAAEFGGPFYGIPERHLGVTQTEDGEAEDDDGPHVPIRPALQEWDRLGAVVQSIDHDTSIAPRGTYRLRDDGKIRPSSSFRGLTWKEAMNLRLWVHLRPPENFETLKLLSQDDARLQSNTLDCAYRDVPKGCWAIRQDVQGNAVTLRSLVWPGYVAYHIPGTPYYGGAYIGNGDKTNDLPFILP